MLPNRLEREKERSCILHRVYRIKVRHLAEQIGFAEEKS
jgi:hypothetical protein